MSESSRSPRAVEQWLITAPQGTFEAILDVTAERSRQEEKGYTPEHDDQHGVGHLVIESRRHLNIYGNSGAGLAPELQRREILQATALLVAALEALDRQGGEQAWPEHVHEAGTGRWAGCRRCWLEATHGERMS